MGRLLVADARPGDRVGFYFQFPDYYSIQQRSMYPDPRSDSRHGKQSPDDNNITEKGGKDVCIVIDFPLYFHASDS